MLAVAGLAAASLLMAVASGCSRAPDPRKPNIVLIVADDLGWGDLGVQGQRLVATPRIDALASEGLRFVQAYAGSTVCAPSRSALMTGQHTGHTRVRGNLEPAPPLLPEDTTVAEILKQAGYATGMFGKWGLGGAGTSGLPSLQGFDHFFGYLDQEHAHDYWTDVLWEDGKKVPIVENQGGRKGVYSHDLIVERALAFIDEHRSERFFLYLPFTLPHGPFDPPSLAPYETRDWPEPKKALAAMIGRLDDTVGRVLAKLDEYDLARDTLVVFTSDNGAGPPGVLFFGSNGPFRGFKRNLYEGGIRVPFIARWPGHIKPGTTQEVLAFWDVLPTLAELVGVAAPSGIDGLSMLPVLLGGPPHARHAYLYWEFHVKGFSQAVRLQDWKAVRRDSGLPLELYDLRSDPSERQDLAAQHADVVARIERILASARTESELWPGSKRSDAH